MGDALGTLGIILFLFGMVVAILWILMPFAVFGLKDRIDETNRLLRLISEQLADRKNV
jgi:hypothetical protein